MNPTLKRYLVSSLTTFASVFLTTIGAQIAVSGTTQWTSAAVIGVLLIATRAAFKAGIEAIPSFGPADNLS